MTNNAPFRPDNIDSLTSLRFFASASIVAFHMLPGLGLGRHPFLANGVSFFFVLSGFILTYVYRDITNRQLTEFYIARVSRLWPVHLLTLALFLALIPQGWRWATGGGTTIAITNALLLQAWVPSQAYALSFNSVSWSISAEVFFYAVFPLIVTSRNFWSFYFLMIAGTLYLAAAGDQMPLSSSGPWSWSWSFFVVNVPIMRLAEFTTGIAIARVFISRRHPLRGTFAEIAAIALVVINVAVAAILSSDLGRQGQPAFGLWLATCGSALSFGMLVFVFAHQGGAVSRVLAWRPLVVLGEISFSTYMLHLIVIRVFQANTYFSLNTMASVVAMLAIIYGGSYLTWRYCEVPSRRGILGLYRNLRRNRYAADPLTRSAR